MEIEFAKTGQPKVTTVEPVLSGQPRGMAK